MPEALIEDLSKEELAAILGTLDENARALRNAVGVQAVVRGNTLALVGTDEQIEVGMRTIQRAVNQLRSRRQLSADDFRQILTELAVNPDGKNTWIELDELGSDPLIEISGPRRRLRARTPGQNRYLTALRTHDLTICTGPAGTGKTYLAVAAALESLHHKRIKRIVLVRPLVEAGEKLGFLPGDIMAKVHPFLRPLLDALRDMLDFHDVKAYLENDIVEIVPLAYMRGRTLNESFIILDEAQNTTIPQMKMFLTRMGTGSKIVVTGDTTQVDLPHGTQSGLEDCVRRLEPLERVAVVRMKNADIVRHPLVEAIVRAYEIPQAAAQNL